MNCEHGDIAIIIRGPLMGSTVLCESLCAAGPALTGGPVWHVEPLSHAAKKVTHVSDVLLRPLRDKPGTDETLLWLRLPGKAPMTKTPPTEKRVLTDAERRQHIRDCGDQADRARDRGDYFEAWLWLAARNDVMRDRVPSVLSRQG